jgi:hypothetical protein
MRRIALIAVALVAAAGVAAWALLGRGPKSDADCHAECAEARQSALGREWKPGKRAPNNAWEAGVSAECQARCIVLMGIYP